MKIGVQDIRNVIYDQWKRAGYKGGMRPGQFAQDTAEMIYELLRSDMEQQRDYSQPYTFPADLLPICERLKNGLKLGELKRNEKAAEVYRWLKEQEENGKSLDTFIAWANGDDQKKYIPKYYANPEWLKVDFPRAFENTSVKFTSDGKGGLYV